MTSLPKQSTPLFDNESLNDHKKMLEDIFGNVQGRQQDSQFYNEAGGIVRKAVPEVGLLDDIGKIIKFIVIAGIGIGAVYLGYQAYQTLKNPLGALFGTNLTPQQKLAQDLKNLIPTKPTCPIQAEVAKLFPSTATSHGVTTTTPNVNPTLQQEIAALFHMTQQQPIYCNIQCEINAFNNQPNTAPGLCCCFFNSIFGNCFISPAECPGISCFTCLGGFCPYCNILQSSVCQPSSPSSPACCFFQDLFFGGCPGGGTPSCSFCSGFCSGFCPGFCPGACPGF